MWASCSGHFPAGHLVNCQENVRLSPCENTEGKISEKLKFHNEQVVTFLIRDGPKTEKTKEYKYLRMKKERPRDSRALGDKGWRRCWCALNKKTKTIFCCVLLMWKTNSGECPDPIVWTFSRVDFWKRHISHIHVQMKGSMRTLL